MEKRSGGHQQRRLMPDPERAEGRGPRGRASHRMEITFSSQSWGRKEDGPWLSLTPGEGIPLGASGSRRAWRLADQPGPSIIGKERNEERVERMTGCRSGLG